MGVQNSFVPFGAQQNKADVSKAFGAESMGQQASFIQLLFLKN